MVALSFGTRLNAQSWATGVLDLKSRLPTGWRSEHGLAGQHIVVDLSEVGFADFVSLGHLLVFLHAAVDAGAEYSIQRPYQGLLGGEDPLSPEAAIRRIRRRNCLLYLEQCGFTSGLLGLPRAERRLPEVGPAASPPVASAPTPNYVDDERLPHRRRKLLPYRWLPVEQIKALTEATGPATLEAELAALGLSPESGAALAKGVLAELLDNAARHSGASRILLGGCIVPPETFDPRVDDFDRSLTSFAEYAARVRKSPLIRLIVADAGHSSGDAVLDGTGARTKIWRAFDHPVTTGLDEYRGPHGYWKVTRIIRGYEGALLVSTPGATVARVFRDHPEPEDIDRPRPVDLPSTVVECCVLVRPDREWHTPGEQLTPHRRPGASRPELDCVTATLNARSGFSTDDLARIRDSVAGLPADTAGLVVAVNVPDGGDAVGDAEIGLAISQMITIANSAPNESMVALAFPSINRPLMNVAVEYLNAAYDARAAGTAGVPRPILVLAPDNHHVWVGGSAAARHLLTTLSLTDTPLPLHEVAASTDHGTTDVNRAVLDLQAGTRLIHTFGRGLTLRVRPQDIVLAMAYYVGDEIRRGIGDPNARGVWHGHFLTPNLREASVWCNVDELLPYLQLEGLTGYTLATRVEGRIGPVDGGPGRLVILRVGPVPKTVMAALTRSLIGRDEYFESIDDMRLERLNRSPDLPLRVLLVTDIISSQRTMVHALLEVVDREMTPVGVATIVDGRHSDVLAEQPDEIGQPPATRVPLVSLARLDLEPRADRAVEEMVAIDPVIRRPRGVPRRLPRTLFDQADYVAAVEATGAARLGHIERPAGRHYTAYVDATLLFRDPNWTDAVMKRLVHKVWSMQTEIFGNAPAVPVCVLHPTDTENDLPDVAAALCERLEAEGFDVRGVAQVPRAAHHDQWHLADVAPFPEGTRHVIILAAAAGTGRTLRHLIQLAADGEVAAISAMLLLNGLSDSEAMVLQQAATVRRPGYPSGRRTVPVRMDFVARTAMSGRNLKWCAVCELRQEYRSLSFLAPLPAALDGHLEWLLQTLEPLSKAAAFQEQATDVFGANVSQQDCVAYLNWRYDLREADRDTTSRREVDIKLASAAERPLERDALIRLLVAESHRLRSAPLWFLERRRQIADLAISLLTGDLALSTDQMLRVQAVILLAHASPEQFAEHFTQILSENRHQPAVVLQTLLEAFRLIYSPTASTSHARDLVTQPLTQKLNGLAKTDGVAKEPHAPVVTRNLVRYLLSHGQRVLQPEPADAQAAWASLRDHRRAVDDHDYENAMWRVIRSVSLIGRARPPRNLEGVRDDWAVCSDFLVLEVLPNVIRLRDALQTAKNHGLRREDATRWAHAAGPDGPNQLDDITQRLDSLLDEVTRDRTATFSVNRLLDDLRWWYQHFLRASPDVPGLAQIIKRCPTPLLSVLRDEFQEARSDSAAPGHAESDDIEVFCTDRVLKDLFTHIRLNAEFTHRDSSGVAPEFRYQVTDAGGGRVRVEVDNTASASSSRGGRQGLRAMAEALAPFDAELRRVDVPQPWTYGIAVTLERWRKTL